MGYTSQYPPAHSDTYVKSTTKRDESYWAYYATNPAASVIGNCFENTWIADGITNQRFHIDLGSPKTVQRIYYENHHYEGTGTDRGVQNFTFWGSNTEASFLELAYGVDTGWTELTVNNNNKFDEHIGADQADPKYINVTNLTAYRYYALKFADNHGSDVYMAVRRIELQTPDLIVKQLAEAFSVVDSKVTKIVKELSEAWSVADSLVKNVTKQLAEAFSVADSWAVRLNLSEAFSVADIFIESGIKNLADTLNIVDSKITNGDKSLNESFTITDSWTMLRRFTETLKVADSVIKKHIIIMKIRKIIIRVRGGSYESDIELED